MAGARMTAASTGLTARRFIEDSLAIEHHRPARRASASLAAAAARSLSIRRLLEVLDFMQFGG